MRRQAERDAVRPVDRRGGYTDHEVRAHATRVCTGIPAGVEMGEEDAWPCPLCEDEAGEGFHPLARRPPVAWEIMHLRAERARG